jgi:hypothetical protein
MHEKGYYQKKSGLQHRVECVKTQAVGAFCAVNVFRMLASNSGAVFLSGSAIWVSYQHDFWAKPWHERF